MGRTQYDLRAQRYRGNFIVTICFGVYFIHDENFYLYLELIHFSPFFAQIVRAPALNKGNLVSLPSRSSVSLATRSPLHLIGCLHLYFIKA